MLLVACPVGVRVAAAGSLSCWGLGLQPVLLGLRVAAAGSLSCRACCHCYAICSQFVPIQMVIMLNAHTGGTLRIWMSHACMLSLLHDLMCSEALYSYVQFDVIEHAPMCLCMGISPPLAPPTRSKQLRYSCK